VGNETAWWHDLGIKPLEIAKTLWEESRAKMIQMAAKAYQQHALADPPEAAPSQDVSKLPNEPN
jgi:phage gp46-like protein